MDQMRYQKKRKGALGSNQYQVKHKARYWGSLALLAIAYLLVQLGIFGIQEVNTRFTVAFASESLVESTNNLTSKLRDENKIMLEELEAYKAKHPNPTEKEIEAYVKTIFGRDAKVAIEVSHHECGTWDKTYPKCRLHTSAEDSIGLFQINLYNKNGAVHANRIPGVTMAEKQLWLENPLNNTLYAYWTFKTSGWCPWSGFKNNKYIQEMAGYSCK